MATVPYVFACDRQSGFILDPNEHKCVGYITDFGGLGMSAPLAKDLKVTLPYANPAPAYKSLGPVQSSVSGHSTVEVVGVLEKFEWEGGVGDSLNFSFYASQENATRLKSLQQSTLKSTRISELGFWIADYDQETKQWYEKAYPLSSGQLSGQLSGRDNPELNVDLTGVPAKDGIDVMVYKISIKLAPPANHTTTLLLANSSRTPVVKQWGLVVGSLSAKPYEGSV